MTLITQQPGHIAYSTILAIALPLFTSSPTLAVEPPEVNCENPTTQIEMNVCEHRRWHESDRQLNQTYQALRPSLSPDQQEGLTTAQLKWIAFRDAECDLYSSYAEGGSMQPMLRSGCAANLTSDRTAELITYQEGKLPYGADWDYETVDRVLNHVYDALRLSISDHRQEELVTAELAWIEYRDASCAFEQSFILEDITQTQCLSRMTEERTGQLFEYLQEYY